MRRGLRNNDQKPNRNRSSGEGLGARRRERLITRSCWFMCRLSATTALAPPGPMSLAIVDNRGTISTSRSFKAEQRRGDCFQEQDSPSYRFQVIITNSPHTGEPALYEVEVRRALTLINRLEGCLRPTSCIWWWGLTQQDVHYQEFNQAWQH